MGNSLGTLWFGADIDLTKLKQKIQQGNKDVLDALKMDYDHQSYTQMVSKIRSNLARETFEIKLSANTQNIVQNIRNATKGGGGSFNVRGLDSMNDKILRQQTLVNDLKATVDKLFISWQKLGGSDRRSAYLDAKGELATEKARLQNLLATRKAYNDATRDSVRAKGQAAAAARQLASDHVRLNTTLAGGIHISTQLGSALSGLFAVHTARQFLGNVIEIGGQLEKQRISIGAILGDTVKANKLFSQIKELAIHSPFGVVELDQYTKQLSAYGFQYNELFDMTKRLADISAGAGTDIGRLTLALGHVRSATYLTGITLRQFSMNNIPMLKMLADYYTELEGKVVSTAEVQKRISQRKVSYQDVIEQIKRLTDEGGMFYNMQEKISDSVAAKWKNLKDAMDIMYGEMAEGATGDMLKGVATELTKLTRHWSEIGKVMSVAALSFLLSKTRIGLNTMAMQGNTAATLRSIMATKQQEANNLRAAASYRTLTTAERIKIASSNSLTAADLRQAMAKGTLNKEDVLRLVALKRINIAQVMHLAGINGITAAEIRAAAAAGKWRVALAGLNLSLKNAFAGVGAGTWATIGLMVGTEIYSAYSSWVDRIDGKTKEMQDIIKSRIIDLEKEQKVVNTNGKPKDTAGLKARVDDMKQVLANSEAYTESLKEQLKHASGISDQYDILMKAISGAVEKNRQMLQYQVEIGDAIMASSVYSGTGFWDKMGQGMRFFFNDDIQQNLDQTNDSYVALRKVIDGAWEYKEALKGVIEEMLNSNNVSEDFKEQLRNAPFEEQIRLLAESGYWQQVVSKIVSTDVKFVEFTDKIKQASSGVTERWDEIATDDIPRMLKRIADKRGMDEKDLNKWATDNIDDFRMMLDGIADQLGVKEPEIRRRLKRLFYDYVRFGDLDKGLAEGAMIGASIFDDENLKKLLEDDPLASLEDENKAATKTGKDKELEAAKTRFAEIKAFLSEYKKYIQHYDKDSAINILEKLFPTLKGQGYDIVDKYESVLDKLRNSLALTTEARKKFANEIDKTKADTLFDRDTEALKKNADAMKEYMTKLESQWKEYRSLLKKSGGNREFASMAFTDGMIWDETAKNMLTRFNERGAELGVIPMAFSWKFSEKELKDALRNTDGIVQDELVDLAKEIQKVVRGNYTQFLEDSAEAYSKSLTAAQKLLELERQRSEIEAKKKAYNGSDPNVPKGYDAQIGALDKQISNQRWEAFKEVENYGRIFGNLDNISTQTLQHMREKLLDLMPAVSDNVEVVKALYEAIEKIDGVVNGRNPFKAMGDALSKAAAIRGLLGSLKGSKDSDTVYISQETSEKTGIKAGKRTVGEVRREGKDGQKKSESDFMAGLNGLKEKFGEVQDALQPVITLFETLGNTDLSNFFQMGSNALGAAAQMGQGATALFGAAAGPWGAAAGAALSVVSSIAAMHDESLQKEIEASKQRMKVEQNLAKNLETALERALGGIYNVGNTEQGQEAMRKFAENIRDYGGQYEERQRLERELAEAIQNYKEFDRGDGKNPYGKQVRELRGQLAANNNVIKDDTYSYIQKAQETGKYYDQQRAALAIQRDEVSKQLSAEQDKKKSDDSAIEDYKQQLAELEDQIKNYALDMAKTLYDIDLKSWASELTDAIVSAWENGEDAAEAYRDKVKDIIKNLAKNILQQRVLEQLFADAGIDNLIAGLMDKTSGELNYHNVEEVADALYGVGEKSAQAITAVLDSMESKGYIAKDGSSSTASKVIQGGFTENETGLALSYWNSMRADLSTMRPDISAIRISVEMIANKQNVMAEAQTTQLRQIAANTLRNADAADAIYNLLKLARTDKGYGLYIR